MQNDRSPRGTLVSSGVLVGLAGVAFYLFFWTPLNEAYRARSWKVAQCTILTSRIVTHEAHSRGKNRHGTTYSIEIRYSYEHAGRPYAGERYSFMDGGSDSSIKNKRAIVSSYRPGTTVECYVDPDNPNMAVLYRGLPRVFWFVVLPLLMAALGLRGILKSLGQMARR